MTMATRLAVPHDASFLFLLYADTRKSEVDSWGWAEEQRKLFLEMQFNAQRSYYFLSNVSTLEKIVTLEEESIGRVVTREHDGILTIVDVSLLSEFQNRGLGTELICCYQDYAINNKLSIQLHLVKENRAYNLYKKLGFVITGESYPYIAMEWNPLVM
ncbi:GNAT family N-acetyltransferase [Paenibacillus sp. MER 99-2]|uniref:GNAT family N-acetyltransferase n=1 Tax=Paenibacillus sp. MER 99-2 TaxID=2939572 RepID=UPI00203C5B23|nr:GNAT family N-acetyltransferase [Paenibacillus sp. MER 99-2]MCM3176136.1 GNAT family N-acetyltransferase [Paenibacillus sp. MER 99-2]